MKRLSRLPFQLLTFLVLPLLGLLVVVAFGGVGLHQSAMRELIIRHNDEAVHSSASSLSSQIDQHRNILQQIAFSIRQGESETATLDETSEWGETFFDGGIALFDRDGALIAASTQYAGWDPLIFSESVVYEVIVSPGHNTTLVGIVVPIDNQDDNITTNLMGVVSLDALGLPGMLAGLHTEDSRTIYVLTPDGEIIYHSQPSLVGQYAIPPASNNLHYQNREVIVTSATVQSTGWTLVAEESWLSTLNRLVRYSQSAPLVLVPGVLIAAGALWFGLRQIVQPLRELEDRARKVAWGNFAAIEEPVGGIEEIQQLQSTLRHMAEQVRSYQAGMHSYIAAITRGQEDERARLARELHDQTAQSLVALGHRLQMLKPHLSGEPAAQERLTELRTMANQAIDELRRIIRAMRPVYLEELGLGPALQMLARDLNSDGKPEVHFEKHGALQRISAEREMALYRVTQEALNNALNHSNAGHIWLSVDFLNTGIVIVVRDDGQGFTAPERVTDLSTSGHFGLMGMYERCALIGAQLEVESAVAHGTTVVVRLPLT